MSVPVKQLLLEALEKKYEADIASAEATIKIYLTNSVGIGEHAQHVAEVDKQIGIIAESDDKLKILRGYETNSATTTTFE